MELTRTDDVLFLCKNRSSRNGTKLCEKLLYNKREFLEPRTTEEGPLGGHNPPGCAPSPARPGGLSPPGGPADPETDAIKSYFSRKNQGERIIVIHEMEPPSPPVLHREARSGVRLGLRRGGVFVLRHHQPFSIANSMILPTGSE